MAQKTFLFVLADLSDKTALNSLFESCAFDGVMHFASFIQVGESVTDPIKYYQKKSKWMVKQVFADYHHAYGLQKLAAQSNAMSAP